MVRRDPGSVMTGVLSPGILWSGQYLRDPDGLSDRAGCYILDIRLDRDLALVPPARFASGAKGWPSHLSAGHYLYCGSASGPGGLRARVARHFRRDKSVRWHIDRLTLGGTVSGVLAFHATADPLVSECVLAAALQAAPVSATIALTGFGSSDCRRCDSHLFRHHRSLDQLFD